MMGFVDIYPFRHVNLIRFFPQSQAIMGKATFPKGEGIPAIVFQSFSLGKVVSSIVSQKAFPPGIGSDTPCFPKAFPLGEGGPAQAGSDEVRSPATNGVSQCVKAVSL